MTIAIIILSVLALAAGCAVVIANNLTEICQPNEVLVFSGPTRRVGDREVGYRLVQGGRALRIPLLERVDRLDLTNMVIDLSVRGAYSKGGIPLNVQGVANVKIASSEPTIGNAIERFLDTARPEIMRVAKDTLEGNLRGVLATLTPEEVNHDRVKFAQSLLHEADTDLTRLGLSLDMLKIQHVSDDKGYLDSLGRKQTAELQMRSRVAEAESRAKAAVRAAENLETKECARLTAHLDVAKAEAQARITDARTQRQAVVAEQRAQVTRLLAKAEAEVEVQKARVQEVELRLLADEVRPAQARRNQMIEAARGEAAQVVEEGRATAAALRRLSTTWEQAGESAPQIVLSQKLTGLVRTMMDTVGDLEVDRLALIDGQLGRAGGDLAVKAAVASEQLKQVLGVDVPALLTNRR